MRRRRRCAILTRAVDPMSGASEDQVQQWLQLPVAGPEVLVQAIVVVALDDLDGNRAKPAANENPVHQRSTRSPIPIFERMDASHFGVNPDCQSECIVVVAWISRATRCAGGRSGIQRNFANRSSMWSPCLARRLGWIRRKSCWLGDMRGVR